MVSWLITDMFVVASSCSFIKFVFQNCIVIYNNHADIFIVLLFSIALNNDGLR